MAREPSFNFGANKRPAAKRTRKGRSGGRKGGSNAWTRYAGGGSGRTPAGFKIPD